MEWAGNPSELVIQRVNRLQNAIDVMLADAATGQGADGADRARRGVGRRPRRRARVGREGRRRSPGSASATAGGTCTSSRATGRPCRRVTRGEFDVIRVLHVDEKAGRVYFLASPDNPTQQYLYRVAARRQRHARAAHARRTSRAGTTTTSRPTARVAVHTYSTFGTPPRVELDLAARPQGRPHARGRTTSSARRWRSWPARRSSSSASTSATA